MGVGNIKRVYMGWAPTLNGKPMQVLIYMAMVSRDHDSAPWYGLGHEDLAANALGLELPLDDKTPENERARATMLRKVRRHITPLLKHGAIEVKERATFGHLGTSHVVYVLHLDGIDELGNLRSSPFR